MINTATIQFSTKEKYQLVDITKKIEDKVSVSGIKEGICIVTILHASAGLIVNEDEVGLKEDILKSILALAPAAVKYQHDQIDNNARAHVISSIIGTDKSFVIENGKLVRGTWQNIFLVELDGPRSSRKVVISIISS